MRLGFKFAMVLGLTLAILVPLMMIRGVIQERQGYRNEVVRDIASNVGGRQVIGGPVLVVPFEETERAEVAGDDGIGPPGTERGEPLSGVACGGPSDVDAGELAHEVAGSDESPNGAP